MKNSHRVLLNTIILYINMLITMFITLFSTRWVLLALGEQDYGIYNLVAGIIVLFSFLNVAMSAATQRFMSYSQGEGKEDTIKRTFYYSMLMHIFIAIMVVLLWEIGGRYFLENVLDVPNERKTESIIILHCLSTSTFFSILSVPYQATANAHENMLILAVINIIEAVLKLLSALYLLMFNGDRLVLYGFLLTLISLNSYIIIRWYSRKFYKETIYTWEKVKDFAYFKKMFFFAGWNFIGSITSLLRNQGQALLLNIFFGVIINAAYGICNQVSGMLGFFTDSVIRAIRPQIVKSEGGGNRRKMLSLSLSTCKFSFLLLLFVGVPLYIEMPYVLALWLDEVPEFTVDFCRLVIIMSLVRQLSIGISISLDSIGKIKWVQILVGGLHIFVLPVSYLFLKLGYSPTIVLVCAIVEEAIAVIFRIILCHNIAGLRIKTFFKEVLIPCVCICLFCLFITNQVSMLLASSFVRLVLLTVNNLIIVCLLSYGVILNPLEREIISSILVTIQLKVKNAR